MIQRLVAVTQSEEESVPKQNAIGSIPVVDLAYAVGRLVMAGKTTAAEVLQLAADRGQRIALLEAELRELRGGGLVPAPAAKPGRPAAKRVRKAAPKAAPGASTALGAFRKLQGKYMGLLRNFTGPVRERIKAIAKAQKFPAAIAEMKKLLAAKAAPTKVAAKPAPAKKTTSVKKSVATKAAPKKSTMTAKRAAQLKVHGAYIGMMRGLPDAEKAKIKMLAKDQGMEAAIAVMKKAAK